jgi:AcrR family transcriptional regulator
MSMDAREARKLRRHEQVREEILAATRRVLLRGGLAKLTLSAVAKELQLTKAALYHYFSNKEALLFEIVYSNLEAASDAVGAAIAETTSGADALEALIRAAAEYYRTRKDDLRLTFLVPQVEWSQSIKFDADMMSRIRPFNDRMFGAVGDRIRADQDAGRISPEIDGRRLAFTAHTAVLGLLMMEGLVESTDDGPLLHGHQALVDELVAAFRSRLGIAANS